MKSCLFTGELNLALNLAVRSLHSDSYDIRYSGARVLASLAGVLPYLIISILFVFQVALATARVSCGTRQATLRRRAPHSFCSDPRHSERDDWSVRRRRQCDSGILPGSLLKGGVSSDSRFEEGSSAWVRFGSA